MNTEIYEAQSLLGLSSMEKCSEAERHAIESVLAQGKPLPEGIKRDKNGNYLKFSSNAMSDDEKAMLTAYRTLICLRKMNRCLYIIIALLTVLAALAIIILFR